MMEQTTNINNDAEEMKSVSLDNQDSIPVLPSDPDPKPASKPVDNTTDLNFETIAIDTDSNQISISSSSSAGAAEENNNNKSAPKPGHKKKKSVHFSEDVMIESQSPVMTDYDHDSSNPYVNYTPAFMNSSPPFNFKDSMDSVKDVLGRWGKKVEEATREAEDLAENTWQHLKTSPSLMDAALGRIAQGTKILAEGGYEKIFQQTFETAREEKLIDTFACYLSTSAGPVMGVVYVSTAKLAFCSDNPLPYQADDTTEWSFYKVAIPLHQIKAVNPSTSRTNAAEKYIQVISVDNHEFWFMGFLNYGGAVKCLQDALQARDILSW